MIKKYFSDLIFFTKEYYRLLGAKMYLYMLSTIIPAFLDGIGITMIVPLLNLVMSDNTVPTSSGNNQNIAYTLLTFFHITINLKNILLFILGLYTFKFLVAYTNSVFRSYLISLVLKTTRYKLYRQISEMEYLSFQKRSTGYYSNLAGVQINQFISGFAYLALFYTVLITAVSYLAFSFFIDFKFSLMAAIAGGGFALLFSGLNKAVKKLSQQTTDNESRTTAFFIEAIQSFKYLKATAGYQVFLNRLNKEIEQIRVQTFRSERLRGFFHSVNEPLIIMLICLFIFIQVQVMGHSLVGMILSIYLFHRALSNVMVTQKEWQFLMNISGGIRAVSEQLKYSFSVKENSGQTVLDDSIQEIKFEGVGFSYGDHQALKDLTLTIERNKTVAFVGQSGAGKTTIIDLITLLNKPNSGNLFVNGIDTNDLDVHSYRKQIGLVTQDVSLYDDSIANNISLWQQHDHSALEEALNAAYASEFVNQLPEGLQTRIGDRGLRLSGGQKQRLSLARELYKKPSLLILDEATSALDSESEMFIKETLDSLKGKLTIIMIAHRLSTIKEADMIVVLKNGMIQDRGTFEELTQRDEYFRRIVHLQKL